MNWLRYLGREHQILALYQVFLESSGKGLHPAELSRETDLDIHEIQDRLNACPELFVRLPRNPEGLVRYRLTSSASAMEDIEVESLVRQRARTEKLQVVAGVAILASVALVILMTVIPATMTALG